ncbi:guanylate cyclase 32E-like [Babylonia areolata]|uniref:guanylate cyclase 32E-like n=1 Tax=Babylonia areolata TaxID=304850 RepID=UPI003FD677DF
MDTSSPQKMTETTSTSSGQKPFARKVITSPRPTLRRTSLFWLALLLYLALLPPSSSPSSISSQPRPPGVNMGAGRAVEDEAAAAETSGLGVKDTTGEGGGGRGKAADSEMVKGAEAAAAARETSGMITAREEVQEGKQGVAAGPGVAGNRAPTAAGPPPPPPHRTLTLKATARYPRAARTAPGRVTRSNSRRRRRRRGPSNGTSPRRSVAGPYPPSTTMGAALTTWAPGNHPPPQPLLGRTHFDFTLAFLTAIQNNGPGKFTAGAFFFALEQLNNDTEGRLRGSGRSASFRYEFRDTHNMETTATRAMVDLFCNHSNSVSAFIGPDVFCNSAALLATSFDVPYLTYDCNDFNLLRTNVHKFLVVNLEPTHAYVAKSIVVLMEHYSWTSFWLVSGTGAITNAWTDIAQELRTQARKTSITLTGVSREDLNDNYHFMIRNKKPYRTIVEETRYKTRVYVFLGDYNSLVAFLQELQSAGVTSAGEHVVISVDLRSNDDTPADHSTYFLSTEETGDNLTHVRLAAFRNLLLLTTLEPTHNTTEEFRYHVYERNYAPPVNLKRIPHWWPGKKQHDLYQESVYMYDAVKHYGNVVLDLIGEGQDPYNAALVTQRLRNVDIESVQGFKVHINQYGESEGRYVVRSLAYQHQHDEDDNIINNNDNDNNADATVVTDDMSGGVQDPGQRRPVARMWQVGSFSMHNGTTRYQPSNHTFVTWVRLGGPPVSNPKCGFDGSKCGSKASEMSEWKLITVGIVLAVMVLLVIGGAFVGLRHFMYEKRLDRLAWKIEYSAIQLLDDGQLREMMISPGRPRRKVASRWKTFLASVDTLHGGNGADFTERERRQASLRGAPDVRVGLYKGSHVVVRTVMRRHVEVTRALKKALLARKEMTHENINRFIGACIEPPRVFIVSQFCSRRSLWDILQNEDSPLDDMFITSLVQDLHKGMTFIHESEFGYHGNLKSSKCLVDSRWVLKIADFGLRQLAVPDSSAPDLNDEGFCRKLMWRAPELLKSDTAPPEGTQKGDVYSFGIILYELYGLKGPWGDTHLKSTDIIRRLRAEDHASQPGVRPFRPDTSVLTVKEGVVHLLHLCWHPDPDLRPDFKTGIRLRLKPLQQGLLKSNIFDNMLDMMEKHAHNLEAVVAERTEQLSMEKRMTENLLLRMLPRSVADRLKHGKPVSPEQYESVSIYFSDIVGFTELSAQSTPMQIVDMLNDLYTCFDSIIENYDVYKVETIGDAYMVVSGLPIRNGLSHAGEVASMSLHLLASISSIRIRHRPDASIKIRIGIHSGPCCAGVVGLKMPRYCLFGDTVNTASRLETTGEALKIHCSQELKEILDRLGGYHLEERGLVDMKGKGKKLTYFLVGEDRTERMRRISHERLKRERAGFPTQDRDQRCVSVSNLDYRGKIYTMQNGMAHDLGGLPGMVSSNHHLRHLQPRTTMRTIPDGFVPPITSSSSSNDSVDFSSLVGSPCSSSFQHVKNDVPYYTLPSLSSIASSTAASDLQAHLLATARPHSSEVTVTAEVMNGSAFTANTTNTTDADSSVVSGTSSAAALPHDFSDMEAPLMSPTVSFGSCDGGGGGGGGGDRKGQGQTGSHPGECEEPSEMKCLLDDSRSKVTPPSKQLSHLLHGRTPETVL